MKGLLDQWRIKNNQCLEFQWGNYVKQNIKRIPRERMRQTQWRSALFAGLSVRLSRPSSEEILEIVVGRVVVVLLDVVISASVSTTIQHLVLLLLLLVGPCRVQRTRENGLLSEIWAALLFISLMNISETITYSSIDLSVCNPRRQNSRPSRNQNVSEVQRKYTGDNQLISIRLVQQWLDRLI